MSKVQYNRITATAPNGQMIVMAFRSAEYANNKPESVMLYSGSSEENLKHNGSVTPADADQAIKKMKSAGYQITETKEEGGC